MKFHCPLEGLHMEKIGKNKMAKKQTQIQVFKKIKKKRKGVHSKNKNSTLKTSKNYKKRYKGQGR